MASLRSLPAFVPPKNYPQGLSLGHITKICCSSYYYYKKVNRLRTIEEKSPKLQQSSFSPSHLSAKTYDQNNEKPRLNDQKRFSWSLVYLKFLKKTCTSNAFAEFLLREFNRWISGRKSASFRAGVLGKQVM